MWHRTALESRWLPIKKKDIKKCRRWLRLTFENRCRASRWKQLASPSPAQIVTSRTPVLAEATLLTGALTNVPPMQRRLAVGGVSLGNNCWFTGISQMHWREGPLRWRNTTHSSNLREASCWLCAEIQIFGTRTCKFFTRFPYGVVKTASTQLRKGEAFSAFHCKQKLQTCMNHAQSLNINKARCLLFFFFFLYSSCFSSDWVKGAADRKAN